MYCQVFVVYHIQGDPFREALLYTSTQKNLEFSTRVGTIAHR